MVTMGGKQGLMGSTYLMGSVPICNDEKFWRWMVGDGYTTMWMSLKPLNCKLKMAKMVHYMLCTFYHNTILKFKLKKI